LVSVDENNTLSVWAVPSAVRLSSFQLGLEGVCCSALSPDGRLIATGYWSGEIVIRELATGGVIKSYRGHESAVECITFSTDGRALVSGGMDTQLLVWDIPPQRPPTGEGRRKRPEAEALWEALASSDARDAYSAVEDAVAFPELSLALFRARINPVPSIPEAKIARLLNDLDADSFFQRESAKQGMKTIAEAAEAEIYTCLASPDPGIDRGEYLAKLVKDLERSPRRLRLRRVIGVAEAIGDEPAKAFLQRLATGRRGAWLTEEANAALRRLP
jgi:hypothetical protein